HVLEHVPDPTELVGAVARGLEPGGVAYLEVPDGWYLVDRVALWDVIYEHVHHVTAPALRRLAADAGLRLLRAGTAFGDQFLWADAVRADDPRAAGLPAADPGDGARVEAIVAAARRFGAQARLLPEAAAELVAEAAAAGRGRGGAAPPPAGRHGVRRPGPGGRRGPGRRPPGGRPARRGPRRRRPRRGDRRRRPALRRAGPAAAGGGRRAGGRGRRAGTG